MPTEELAAANADFFGSKFIRETTFSKKISYHDKPSPSISLDVMDEAKVDANNISPEHGRIIWDRQSQFAALPQKMEKHSSYLNPPSLNLPICNRRQLQVYLSLTAPGNTPHFRPAASRRIPAFSDCPKAIPTPPHFRETGIW
jgi:hypothetical protein